MRYLYFLNITVYIKNNRISINVKTLESTVFLLKRVMDE